MVLKIQDMITDYLKIIFLSCFEFKQHVILYKYLNQINIVKPQRLVILITEIKIENVHQSKDVENVIYSLGLKIDTLYIMNVSTVNPSSLNLNTVEPLTGVNYRKWKQDLEIVLGVMDWDLALRTEEPLAPTDDSTSNQKSKYEKWHKSNRITLLIIKMSMTYVVRGGFPDATNAKNF